MMRYRLTLESGLFCLVDDVAHRHFLRQAVRRGYGTTRVRGGHVVTLPGGRLAALIAEGASND
ncbi:hypothetical protein ABZ446_28685 [Streptomyces sp. NPDC005813]|uniref:hypothetical protein n=1 Tax=Streptomyces sp. NPDC005813 TaxID=3155592 RepID=UPI0033EE7686